jgi:hypothetical protein
VNAWAWGALAFGGACVVLGVAVRLGYQRSAFLWYNVDSAPKALKNGPFALIPFGLFFVLLPGGALLQRHGEEGLGTTALLGAFLSVAVGFWFGLRPPAWMKPTWLRNMERAEPVGPDRSVSNGRRISRLPVWAPVWWGLLAVAVGLSVLRAVFDWPYSLWVGVGSAMMQLAAMRPTSRQEAKRFSKDRKRQLEEVPPTIKRAV